MRVLINCSTLKKGGGVQVGLSFLNEIKEFSNHKFTVVVSDILKKQLNISEFSNSFEFFEYNLSPKLKGSILGIDSYLGQLEDQVKPNVVFSIFGPTYWKSKAPHVVGYAKPQYVYKHTSPFYRLLSVIEKIKFLAKEKIQLYNFRKFANVYITESPDVSEKLKKLMGTDLVYTVTNNYSGIYENPKIWKENSKIKKFNGSTLLTISENYPHKNLAIIPKVVAYLNESYPDFKFRFVLTLDEKDFAGVTDIPSKNIECIGHVNVNECPHLYEHADIMFLPTLLECFSANYPEAMKMEVPIITSDLSFAHGICGDAAYYINPLSFEEIGDAIVSIATNDSLRNRLIEQGKKQVQKFDTSTNRAMKYIKILEDAAGNTRP